MLAVIFFLGSWAPGLMAQHITFMSHILSYHRLCCSTPQTETGSRNLVAWAARRGKAPIHGVRLLPLECGIL